MISVFAVILSLTVVISAETGELPVGSNPTYVWCYYTDGATVYKKYPNQLTQSDIVAGSDTFLYVPRQTSKNYLNNYFGDYVQLDFYFSFGAASPTLSGSKYFQGIQMANQWIAAYPSTSLTACPVAAMSPVVPIRSDQTGTGSTVVCSFLFRKSDVSDHIFSYSGVSKLAILLDVNEEWVSRLSSSNVLMFNSIRVVATDELSLDQDTLLAIQEIQAQIDAGVITLSQGQTAIQNKIDAAANQAHQDAQAVQGAIDSAADQAHEDQEALQTLINGDGSYGTPDSDVAEDVDDIIASEDSFIAEWGSALNDDALEDIKDAVHWDDLEVPSNDDAIWWKRVLDPFFAYFPIFILFPLFLGVVATLLGRSHR